MPKRDAHRDLHQALQAAGLLEYGSVIDGDYVREVLDLEMPEVGTKAEYDRIALAELAAIDYVRNILLGQGRYLKGTPSGYRVLLPSENKVQVDNYIASADQKLSRALKLSRNTPKEVGAMPDQTEARILLKQATRHRSSPTQPQG